MRTPNPLGRLAHGNGVHGCCWCHKRRGGCEIEPNPPRKASIRKSWICFHCREARKSIKIEPQEAEKSWA